LNKLGTNNKIILRVWRDKETYVAEDSGIFLVVPYQINNTIRDEFVASNASTALLLIRGQLAEVLQAGFDVVY
jgi:hypothetical protein